MLENRKQTHPRDVAGPSSQFKAVCELWIVNKQCLNKGIVYEASEELEIKCVGDLYWLKLYALSLRYILVGVPSKQ